MCATYGASWNKLGYQYAAVAHGVSGSVSPVLMAVPHFEQQVYCL